MPRINSAEHYKRYQFLHTAWSEFSQLFGLLKLHEQWQLHEFYQPSKYLTKSELIEHIKSISREQPALVHQAGKHVRVLQRVFQAAAQLQGQSAPTNYVLEQAMRGHHQKTPATQPDKDGRRYTTRAIARPELDVALFAKALILLAQKASSGER